MSKNTIARFFEHLHAHFDHYPAGIVPVPETQRLGSPSFFPFGPGLPYGDSNPPYPELPNRRALIVGYPYVTVDEFRERLADPSVLPRGFKTLRGLCLEAGLPLSKCYFTSVLPGLRTDNGTGMHPGEDDPDFVRRSLDLLAFQIEALQPKLLVTLGARVPPLLSRLSSRLQGWADWKSFARIDRGRNAVQYDIDLPDIVEHPITLVTLVHPSTHAQNVWRRYYWDREGHSAEVKMLEDGLQSVRLH
ncbi:MAG: hypothetical protein ACQEVA_11760 [Myxococcota bacterium]